MLRSSKSKQFLTSAVKVLIIALAVYFIQSRLADNDWDFFLRALEQNFTWPAVVLLIFLAFVNRFLEILKWQNLVSSFKGISVAESAKQVLAALTAAIFTPNGIGEYGAKALYFEKSQAKRIVFLNLVCNGAQMLLSIFFGVIGLVYLNLHFDIIGTKATFGVLFLLVVATAAFLLLRNLEIKGYSLKKAMRKMRELPKGIHRKNLLLALGRYIVFSHQYYFIFLIFDVELSYATAMATVCAVYFLSSSLPTFQFLDFAVKGSVAVYFFGLLGVNEWIPVFAATMIWLLNVVLPVIIGSYYVITFKPAWK